MSQVTLGTKLKASENYFGSYILEYKSADIFPLTLTLLHTMVLYCYQDTELIPPRKVYKRTQQ
jgi:hypothetical protein